MQLQPRDNATALYKPFFRDRFKKRKPMEGFSLLLPDNPAKDAIVSRSEAGISVFASVSKKRRRERCQDIALASTCRGHSLLGVFDGFMSEGDFVPTMVADNIAKLWLKRMDSIRSPGDMGNLLFDAAKKTLMDVNDPFMSGGTTAIVAVATPERRVFIASAGDSAGYAIDAQGKVRNLFNNDMIYIPPGYVARINDVALDPDVYVYARNILATSISKNFSWADIATGEDFLEPGSRLLLVSDGITKNLFVEMENGKIRDASGCKDLEIMVRGVQSAEQIGALIAEKARTRAKTNIRRTINDQGQMGHMLLPADDDMAVVVFSPE